MSQTASDPTHGLGRIGIWSMELRFGDAGQAREGVAELDELGYGAVWTPGGLGGDMLGDMGRLLDAAPRIAVAAGILNIWKHETAEVGAWWKSRSAAEQGRLMLGLGVSHGPTIGEAYKKPLSVMNAYLDGLDAEGVPAARRCLAALGPKMLDLSRDRSAGAHPYLITPEHTAEARERLGPGALLAPEQGVVLERDPGKARELARQALSTYLRLPNYRNNWLRLGFSEDEIEGSSDRLIDALFAWGDVEAIVRRVREHQAAGADHVCLQVIHPGGRAMGLPRAEWRELAAALI